MNAFIVAVIVVAVVAGVLATEPDIYEAAAPVFIWLEVSFGLLFLLEYLLRLWSIAEDRGSASPLARRLHFVISPAGLIDLFVVLAAFAPAFGLSASTLRLVRLIRIARLAKLGRMSRALLRLNAALRIRRYELLMTLVLAAGALLAGATTLYWLEGDVQPDQFGSIPRSLWWAVITLTTIGYGDVYPITPAGKIAASFLALAGVGLIALPAGIMAGAMQDVVRADPKDLT